MSRIGRTPIPVPSGVEVTLADRQVTVKGPKGTLARSVPGEITVRQEDSTLLVERPDDERHEPGPARPDPQPGQQHGRRGHRRLQQGPRDRRRRLPGHRQRPEPDRAGPGFQPPGGRRRPRRGDLRGPRSRPASPSGASTRSWSARSPPTSARSASPSPTREKVSVTPASGSSARPARPPSRKSASRRSAKV